MHISLDFPEKTLFFTVNLVISLVQHLQKGCYICYWKQSISLPALQGSFKKLCLFYYYNDMYV